MTISIEQKSDTLPIPAPIFKAFTQKLSTELTEGNLKKKLETTSSTISEENIKKLLTGIKSLNDQGLRLKENGPPILFHVFWNAAFKENEEVAKKLFESLTTEINTLATEANKAVAEDKKAYMSVAAAAKAANAEIENILKFWGQLNTQISSLSTITESINKQLIFSKKLLNLGFNTEAEHLAKLLEIKKSINETASAPPLPSEEAIAIASIGGEIANIGADNGFFKEYATLITMIQDAYTKKSQENLSESKKNQVKSFIKKRILQEIQKNKRTNNKEYLNEFLLLAALAAALFGLGAWVGKKFAQYGFNTGIVTRYPPTYPKEHDHKELAEEVQESIQGYVVYPDGSIHDISTGKPADPNHEKELINGFIKIINDSFAKYQQSVSKVKNSKESISKSTKITEPAKTQIIQTIDALPATITSHTGLITALQAVLKT